MAVYVYIHNLTKINHCLRHCTIFYRVNVRFSLPNFISFSNFFKSKQSLHRQVYSIIDSDNAILMGGWARTNLVNKMPPFWTQSLCTYIFFSYCNYMLTGDAWWVSQLQIDPASCDMFLVSWGIVVHSLLLWRKKLNLQ